MSETITFTIDGVEVQGRPGQTIIQAADEAGVYIPGSAIRRTSSRTGRAGCARCW